ncbi:SurA N-terminal domain-containing protein [Chitinophaga lutea]
MSVIQKIRDKYAVLIIVLICVAIVSFLLQDVFFGSNSMFRQTTTVGKVNGEELNYQQYNDRIEAATNQARMQGMELSDADHQAIREQVWNEFLRENIMKEQYEELGIEVTQAELDAQFNAKNPHPLVQQFFADPNTGVYDPANLANIEARAAQDPQLRAQLLDFDSRLAEYQKSMKYLTLINRGIGYPKWVGAQQQADFAQQAAIDYVLVPYATIADSTIKVNDSELNKYIQDHKARFQTTESRRFDYLSFNIIPSPEDTAAAMTELNKLKAEMDTTADIASFIRLNSAQPYTDVYVSRNAVAFPMKDSVIDLPVGAIYGPYADANTITYAKMLDRKTLPDTVKFNQIILQITASDSITKRLADSLETAIRGGADFATLAGQFSIDPSARQNGGEYTMAALSPVPENLKEVRDFLYAGKAGDLKTIHLAAGGYAVVKIKEQKNFGPAIKVAYLAKRIDPTPATSSAALSKANEFASKNRDFKSFNKTIQEQGLDKRIADNVRPNDLVINNLGSAREIVNWIYKAEKGDISPVFTLEDRFVIGTVSGVRAEGTAPLDEVRPQVEAEVRRIKKAGQIMDKMKSPASLEAAASATNQPVLNAAGIRFGSPFIASVGDEGRVVGASFNKAWGATKVSDPIEGNSGVFVIKVSGYTPTGDSITYDQLKNGYESGIQQYLNSQLFEVLKKKASVKDNRRNF